MGQYHDFITAVKEYSKNCVDINGGYEDTEMA